MDKRNRKSVKLQLSRETLKNLASEEMNKVKGGGPGDCTGCDSGCGIAPMIY